MSNQKDEDMLNEYPDLSDEDDVEPVNNQQPNEEKIMPNSQPHKLTKLNQGPPPTSKPIFTAPLLFGGKNFIPPPPPPGSKGKMNFAPPPPPPANHTYPKMPMNNPQSSYKMNEQQPRPERERKNCVFVKNIPKHYNQVQKLMTFFKNEGQIRQIKVNHDEFSATVRFAKEQDSIKFINSNKAIFNRSFITYSLNEKDVVPVELVKERENDEAGKIKKPIEVQMKQLRDRLQTILADKIRALLFLVKNVTQENALASLKAQLNKSIEQKSMIHKYTYEQLDSAGKMITNEYDWTIAYTFPRNIENEKKGLLLDLQKKFGPVSTLDFTPINVSAEKAANPGSSEAPEQAAEYIVKLQFLGIKSSWEYYYFKTLSQTGTLSEEKDMEIEGSRLKGLFNEGIIKKPSHHVLAASSSKDEAREELVEIGQNGVVRVVEQLQRVVEQQVVISQIEKVGIAEEKLGGS